MTTAAALTAAESGAAWLNRRTTVGFGVLTAAVGLGALGDGLLRATPWGVNTAIWVTALAAALTCLLRWQRIDATAGGRSMLLVAVFFASGMALRDSPAVRTLDGLALLVTLSLGLAALRAWPGQLRIAALTDYALTVCYACVHAAAGAYPLLFREIGWREVAAGGRRSAALAAARGALIALPLLVLFGGLFVAADATFERLVTRAFRWDAATLFGHLYGFVLCTWVSGGLLRGVLIERRPSAPPLRRAPRPWLGPIEMATFLGLLNALFLSFVLVQVRYFFGGASTVLATDGMTYAAYARRGFFELVAVAALVLPLLLLTHSMLRKEHPVNERLYRLLAGSLVALLFVVMASALQRMFLYQRLYGLTELRLYTTAFMGWLGAVFVWFVATVLRGRRRRFGIGALTSGLAVVVALNLLNPDELIIRTNATRVAQGSASQTLDDLYAASLSADGVPALLVALPVLPAEQQDVLARQLLHRWSPPAHQDWRTWNWGRAQAWRAVAAHEATLKEMAR
jgi:hypothetical protein